MSHGHSDVGRFPGLWLGIIVENKDPDGRNRAKVRVPGVYADDAPVEDLPWADICTSKFGIAHGQIKPPPIDCRVWVEFRQAHEEYPIIMGGQIIDKDSTNGTEIGVTDGDRAHLVTGTDEIQATNRHRAFSGEDVHIVDGSGQYQYRKLSTIVIDGVTYSYGTKEETVNGNSAETVKGSKIIKILGSKKVDVSGSIDLTVGEDERAFVMGRINKTACNALSLPSETGISYTSINSKIELNAKTIIGVSGGLLSLDPLGVDGKIVSLLNFMIDAGLFIRIGAAATLPVTTPVHTHISGWPGFPTSPAIGSPGAGFTSKLLAE